MSLKNHEPECEIFLASDQWPGRMDESTVNSD